MSVKASYLDAYDRFEDHVRTCVKEERFVEAVVLIHTSIESCLAGIIKYKLDNAEKTTVIRDYRFIDLAKICYIFDAIDKPTYEELLDLNNTRNSLAHLDFKRLNLPTDEMRERTIGWLDFANHIVEILAEAYSDWQANHLEELQSETE